MTKCKKNTFMEIAYQGILQKIMHEQFKPGMPLREDHLATELGVSPTPIREAFRRLEYEGWLQSSPFCGVVLRKYTQQDISELYILREALEGIAAAGAALNANEKDLDKIYSILKAKQEYMHDLKEPQQDSSKSIVEQELHFHAAVAEAAHNQLLSQRINMLKAQITYLMMNWKNNDASSEENNQRAWEEHWMIYLSIQRHWEDQAKMLMEKHISFARENHLKNLKEVP